MLNGKSTLNTTSFKITETERRKQLKLINKCEEIIIEKEKIEKYEGIILSPIVNELNKKNNKLINKLDKKIQKRVANWTRYRYWLVAMRCRGF